jgi:hypothetical protein
MTKQSLQAAAELASGISYADSLLATSMSPSLLERVGGEEGFLKLSGKIYKIQYFLFNSSISQLYLTRDILR